MTPACPPTPAPAALAGGGVCVAPYLLHAEPGHLSRVMSKRKPQIGLRLLLPLNEVHYQLL